MVNANSEYDITAAFKAIENELMESMIRNMDRHRAEEDGEEILWSQWQTEQLKALELYKIKNQKKYEKKFRMLNKAAAGLIESANARGNMEQEIKILEAIRDGFKGYREASKTLQGEFFRLNERKLEALVKATTEDMEKAETAILRMANDKYRKVIFNAQVYANTGAGTYEKAIDMATRDFLAAGLNCVEYANGARHTLSDYIDMALRTASKRAYLQGEGLKRQEWGTTLVIMNKRGNPCPKCLPWVGKVLIDDVWSGGKKEDGDYPLMSYAISKGLYHPRCKDSHATYFPGVSTAEDTWTRKELEEVGLQSKEEARQQYTERQAEKYERLAKYSLDGENKRKYAARKEEWEIQSNKYLGKSVVKSDDFAIMELERKMANGMRKSFQIPLSENEKKLIRKEIEEIGAIQEVFVFRDGLPTGYSDERDIIYVSSSVFPSNDGSTHPTDQLSVRATLAHEYYGHRAHRNTKLPAGAWNDEFRASYSAAKNCPNLADEDRAGLIADAIERANKAGITIKLNSFMRRCLYGYE